MRFWLHVNKFPTLILLTHGRSPERDATWDTTLSAPDLAQMLSHVLFTLICLHFINCVAKISSKWSANSFCSHFNHFHKVYCKLVVCPLLCLFWGLFCRKKYSVLFVLDSFRFNFCPKLPSTLSPSLSKASILLFPPRIYSPFCLAELVLIFNSFPLVSLPASFIILYTDFVKFK